MDQEWRYKVWHFMVIHHYEYWEHMLIDMETTTLLFKKSEYYCPI